MISFPHPYLGDDHPNHIFLLVLERLFFTHFLQNACFTIPLKICLSKCALTYNLLPYSSSHKCTPSVFFTFCFFSFLPSSFFFFLLLLLLYFPLYGFEDIRISPTRPPIHFCNLCLILFL